MRVRRPSYRHAIVLRTALIRDHTRGARSCREKADSMSQLDINKMFLFYIVKMEVKGSVTKDRIQLTNGRR